MRRRLVGIAIGASTLLTQPIAPVAAGATAPAAVIAVAEMAVGQAAQRPSVQPQAADSLRMHQTRVYVPHNVYFLEVADFDGDGRADFTVLDSEQTGSRFSTYLAGSDLSFSQSSTTKFGFDAELLAGVGDFTGSKGPDVAITGGYDSDRYFSIFANKGSGRFGRKSKPVKPPGGALVYVNRTAVLDLDADGAPDVAALLGNDDDVVLRNKGKGTFSEASLDPGAFYDDLVTGDFDGDGLDDVVAMDYSTSRAGYGIQVAVQFLRSLGDGTFRRGARSIVKDGGLRLYAGHLDGDDHLDVMGSTSGYCCEAWTALGDGTGAFGKATKLPGETQLDDGALAIDLTGDGKNDIAAADDGRGIQVFRGKGNGTFEAPVLMNERTSFVASLYDSLRTGDVDGDPRPDMFATQRFGSSSGESVNSVVVFTTRDRPAGLTISNLRFTRRVFDTAAVYLTGSFDYRSDGAELAWVSKYPPGGSAFLEVEVSVPMPYPYNSFRGSYRATGPLVNQSAASGTINFELVLPTNVIVFGLVEPRVSVNVWLWDLHLVMSNVLSVSGS